MPKNRGGKKNRNKKMSVNLTRQITKSVHTTTGKKIEEEDKTENCRKGIGRTFQQRTLYRISYKQECKALTTRIHEREP